MQAPKAQQVIDYSLRLDNGMEVDLRLPERLSQAEAARLISYITGLVEQQEWDEAGA